MMHIANATLAGGVAIGTNANSVLDPLDAMVIGVVAGVVSTLGFRYLTVRTRNGRQGASIKVVQMVTIKVSQV